MKFSEQICLGKATNEAISTAFGGMSFAWNKDLDILFDEMDRRGLGATIYTQQAIVKLYDLESGRDLVSTSCELEISNRQRIALAICAAIVIASRLDYDIEG